MSEHLSLKWGTVKAWNLEKPESIALLQRWREGGVSMSAMAQHDTAAQKAIICELIDVVDADQIFLDWDERYVSKGEAKRYVMEYGR